MKNFDFVVVPYGDLSFCGYYRSDDFYLVSVMLPARFGPFYVYEFSVN